MESLRFDDLLLAKVLAEEGIVPVPALQRLLRELDKQRGSLADALILEDLVEPVDGRLERARHKAERFRVRMMEASLAEVLREEQRLDPWKLKELERIQRRSDYEHRLGDMLRDQGLVEEAILVSAEARGLARFERHSATILEQYRESSFDGLSRALSGGKVPGPTEPPPHPHEATRASRAVAGLPKLEATLPAEHAARRRSSRSQRDPLQGKVIGERFRLEFPVGQGSMGIVYFAMDLQENAPAALKLAMDPVRNPVTLLRFEREILVNQALSDDHLARCLAAGTTPSGACYLAMEYLTGDELGVLIAREGRIALGRALGLFKQLLSGLAALHENRIVHKDIKPSNLRVFPTEGGERLKLMDFGIARFLDREDREVELGKQIYSTVAGKVTGTPAYLAPELIRGARGDERADLYAAGITLFEMLTGALPFDDPSPNNLVASHLYSEPLRLRDVGVEAPDWVQEILDKLLEKDPADRFASARAVLAAIAVHPALTDQA